MTLQSNKITTFQKLTSSLATKPNASSGLTAEQVKQWFDSSPEELRVALNNVIDSLVATTGASEIGAVAPTGLSGATVQALLSSLKNYTDQVGANFVLGTLSPGSVTMDMMADSDIIPPQALKFGDNTVVKTSKGPQPVKVAVTGKSYINPLGASGSCESVTPFTAVSGCTLSLDTSKKVFGANALKITLTGATGIVTIPVGATFNMSGYALISAYLDKGTATNIKLEKDATGGGVSKSVISTDVTPTRQGVLCQPSDNNAGNLIKLTVTGTIGQVAYVDGIMDNEISSSEYAMSVATVLDLYPYAEGLATVKNPSVKVQHADGSIEQCSAEVALMSGETGTVEDGVFKVPSKQWVVDVPLFGKDYNWVFHVDGVGLRQIRIDGVMPLVQPSSGNRIIIKGDGKPLQNVSVINASDQVYDTNSNTSSLYISVSDVDSGLPDSTPPALTQIEHDKCAKGIANGWKYTGSIDYVIRTWASAVDGSAAPTQTSDYVSSNVAPNYTGYKLTYKLATPISKEYPIKGKFPTLQQGVNTVTFDTGIVLGEDCSKAMTSDATYAYINNTAYLLKKVESFTTVYKNGIPDINWTFVSLVGNGGKGYMRCTIANRDISAIYTTDYRELITSAPQIGSASLTYKTGIVDAMQDAFDQIGTKQGKDPALDMVVNESTYRKVFIYSSSLFHEASASYVDFQISLDNFQSKYPTVTAIVDDFGVGNSSYITKFTLLTIAYRDRMVLVRFVTTDSATITALKTYGVIGKLNVTLDARKGV